MRSLFGLIVHRCSTPRHAFISLIPCSEAAQRSWISSTNLRSSFALVRAATLIVPSKVWGRKRWLPLPVRAKAKTPRCRRSQAFSSSPPFVGGGDFFADFFFGGAPVFRTRMHGTFFPAKGV